MTHNNRQPPHSGVSKLLENESYRYTDARRRVIEVLTKTSKPLSLPNILNQDSSLSQSSTYRNLEILEQCGAISTIATNNDHNLYELAEPFLGHHHHMICIDCGDIEDITIDHKIEKTLDSTLTKLAAKSGFSPQHHSLDLHGQCAQCA